MSEEEDDDRTNPCPACSEGELEFTFHGDEDWAHRPIPEAEIVSQTCNCELTEEQVKVVCERAEREEVENPPEYF